MSPLPEFYPSPLYLPFNNEALQVHLQREAPDADPGGEGFWLLLRGSELLLNDLALPVSLPTGLDPSGAIYLGRWQGRPCRALAVSRSAALPEDLAAESLQAAEPRLSIELLSLGALAAQQLYWDTNSADRKSTRLNSSSVSQSRMPSSA